jgi:regulator of replication initiation timing
MTDYTELKRLAEAVESCASMDVADESAWMRRTTGAKVVELLEEPDELKAKNESLSGFDKAYKEEWEKARDLQSEMDEIVAERDQLKAENEALRKVLTECTASLEGEMLQKYHGQKPEDMHPVTRRDHDRDMAELAGYRAAMSKGEQS